MSLLIVFQYPSFLGFKFVVNYIQAISELMLYGEQETDSSKTNRYSGEANFSSLPFSSVWNYFRYLQSCEL